jgi:ketosteroid isomerase-like protein
MRTRTIRAALATALLGVVVAGCGGDPQEEIDTAFKGYYSALLARDFPTACGYNTPEATAFLLQTLSTQGVRAGDCEGAFGAIFEQSASADVFDTIARTVRIDGVDVDGDDATVTYTSTVDGEPRTASVPMSRVDGGWKFVAPN